MYHTGVPVGPVVVAGGVLTTTANSSTMLAVTLGVALVVAGLFLLRVVGGRARHRAAA